MRIIQTADITPQSLASFGETAKLWIYNGLDCCVTLEVLEATLPQLDNQTASTYAFSRALQGPILELNMHGILVDQKSRAEVIAGFQKDVDAVTASLNEILLEGLGLQINFRSHQQLKKLFYETLQIPAIKSRNTKGEYTPTVNREALEKLEGYFIAQPLVNHILILRDLEKKISALKTEVDPDGRMRTSYNIGGTTTGRLSSSMNDMGGGGNLQNLEERLRSVFCADKRMKLAYIDLEQAESRAVGAICWNLFGQSKYLDSCESGDLHTSVSRMCFPDLAWSDIPGYDNKKIAEQIYYRQHSYRHVCKVLGHGTSYLGKPFTMAKHTKIDQKAIAEFQDKFFKAFPEIKWWHESVKAAIESTGKLTSLMGRRRSFFGRRTDDSTIREAVAFDPQSSVADILNTGLLNVWRANICQILLQVHDAIVVQYPEVDEDIILPQVLKLIQVPVELRNGRTLLIPSEAKTGWNWAGWSEKNIDGLKKYHGRDQRQRTRHSATHELDKLLL